MQVKIIDFFAVIGSVTAMFTVGKFAIDHNANIFEMFAFGLAILAIGILIINRIGELYENSRND